MQAAGFFVGGIDALVEVAQGGDIVVISRDVGGVIVLEPSKLVTACMGRELTWTYVVGNVMAIALPIMARKADENLIVAKFDLIIQL